MEAHLAQFNTATLRHPLDHPDSVGYAALLDEVNALAEASPGFVWRHGIDSRDDSTSVYENPLTLVNMSVWETPGHLRDYAYRGFHRDVFRRRQEWFVASGAVMWWIPAGTIPSLAEGVRRLAFLEHHGPTPFGFQQGQQHEQLVIVERTHDHPDVLAIVGDGDVDVGSLAHDRPVHVAVLADRPVATSWLDGGEVVTSMRGDGAASWLVAALHAHLGGTPTS